MVVARGLRSRSAAALRAGLCAVIAVLMSSPVSAAFAKPSMTPWSGSLYLPGFGATWGRAALPAYGVYEPDAVTVSFGAGLSIWYVYAGATVDFFGFRDTEPLVQEVVRFGDFEGSSGDGTVRSSASALGGSAELGINYPLRIKLRRKAFVELLPVFTYGSYGITGVSRHVPHCIDCESQTIPVDYRGGPYLGFALGSYWGMEDASAHGAGGITTVYRHFLNRGDASLTGQLIFYLTLHFGRD